MKNKTIIRQEEPKDYKEIYDLIETAFKTAKVKDGDEQDFAVKLRNSENYIPELALVVEYEGKLIAHVMLTKTYITDGDKKFEVLLLAPVSVLLEYRDKGIGSMVIRESFERAKSMGYSSVFLCGDPGYYHRFGFKSTSEFGINNANSIPDQYVMCCELKENALQGVSGIIGF
ncbi:putative N-acetyltransferase YhbS [Dysgonomonas alginatilytica]|uniref:Putative N-acetyltransferase YhbS n=1 Tax=Dysgonomonas alginatilytica TaxID=1605892 RepID=A0A2V3PQW3_9BACT|nr:N-acetyltransferase [Dysgonomonas alginatilytica]PXV66767.1 putative N-acetyltransferase YhbS [Dysgonomonas alginatilytica]